MSSRAIRKLQKLREQQLQQQPSHGDRDDDESEEEVAQRPTKKKFNAFDLLNVGHEEESDADGNAYQRVSETITQPSEPVLVPSKADGSSKKKKKPKKKKTGVAGKPAPETNQDADLDEIDRALKEFSTKQTAVLGAEPSTLSESSIEIPFSRTPEELLAIDPKNLNAINEMKKLFGNVVLENFDMPRDTGGGRRRDRDREMVDLGRALTGRYSPASRGQSLAGAPQRRNILIQGKNEWPRAPSGGLGMEIEEQLSTGATVYRIVHNTSYEDLQRQFEMCVESMDPQRLVHLLQYNPYHISTLLQVSDIAKHQGDHAVSADLLERALFNIGRSAHSSFSNRLKEGKAKLKFIHVENRELWLIGWRYIANLGMKGTWRTAYEWARLLLSLDTTDPYAVRLLIDHLALRGREYAHFVELCTQTRFSKDWGKYPNIQCSLALAYLRLNKPKECREQLRMSMSRYPWIFCKLVQELDAQPTPKQVWGKMPPTESHALLSELYISRAKDLWNTPEAISLIVEVADTISEQEEEIEPPEITLDIARHIVLSDIPHVTTHLPSHFISSRISASDPLPPYDSEAFRRQSDPRPSWLAQVPETGRPQWLRDLLDQLNNGVLRFAGLGPDDENLTDDESGDGHLEDPEARREYSTDLRHPPADQQPPLEQWLLGEGLQNLRDFLQRFGVDRGNWDESVDMSQWDDYVDALRDVQSIPSRDRLLYGPISEAVGDIVVDMLKDQLTEIS